jgi:hypothetical protein
MDKVRVRPYFGLSLGKSLPCRRHAMRQNHRSVRSLVSREETSESMVVARLGCFVRVAKVVTKTSLGVTNLCMSVLVR